ncbi:phosphoenolpyruvate carboxylase [Alloalcanivorax xenomutans]|uniref:Phosphoenolpyruvate carboxylase n=1 Tax=Alloalcanivorax xenomutans TaxID=1094342 RepID=A0A9Q3W8J6_9GAMM|nr:phosphoenolpyruvate carboxylase [Alloalcanivorax xenomutans]MBA4721195.1 phosphoenolpyruvate carboxylase [Alcanivorax sp.]MCE7510038.1 phosphoenolpyruvate carboxylase [Alloalcanivorax xenomutans]PHS59704.1 MAG: phosphoenolpyruvate carboxylase [Alcanivorax sp.]WOD27281.1 phosphoenolpyruvate carboxylase [Alloalcanivorax xenomutans]CUR44933.1 Phosphoenolpyruvate carboxylase [Alloalcanivorax xenomutans]
MEQDQHAPLREDVRWLGELLGHTLREQVGENLYETVERIRLAAVETRSNDEMSVARLRALLDPLEDDALLEVARAFSQFLNLANIAEQHHRERLHRQHQRYPGDPDSDQGLRNVLERLSAKQVSAQTVRDTLTDLSVELVLTAHPTEVTRRTLIRKYDQMADLLTESDRPDLTGEERQRLEQRLRELIISAWSTDEIRRERPTPVDEAKWGFATIEQSLWRAVPDFMRQLDEELQRAGLPSPPADWVPVRLASWMGGDRDGNPNVTAAVTREVLLLARWMAADLYLRDVENLLADLSMHRASDELLARTGPSHEPYRVVLRDVRDRLKVTRRRMEALVEERPVPDGEGFLNGAQLRDELRLLDRSLRAVGLESIANGQLKDTLRRLSCFGITLLCLDVRQESGRHADTIDAITRYLELGSYLEWDEAERQRFLLAELENRRPLVDELFYRSDVCDPQVREVLDTCKVIAEQGPEGLGAYVISMARAPSDVLAVMLLQKIAGVTRPMRVVPLFETLDDLDNAGDTMSALLSIPFYRERVKGGQEVMIGYSDSAKDAGFLGAAWAQFRAQEKLTGLFREHGIPLTLFHGRGGSISRGGSPTRMALLSQPSGSVAGRIRVTEQGEVIRFKYGRPSVAAFNLEQYVAATLEATLLPPREPRPQWREQMEKLTRISVEGYRQVVRDDPALVRYLRTVTPETELSRLALGSRPARRKSDGGIESLRAIPWVFAWTQIRLMLPAWLGTGAALEAALEDQSDTDRIREMASHWPFFQGVVDMLEMVLAKADSRVAAWYEERLTDDADLMRLGDSLRQRLAGTVEALGRLTGRGDLLDNNPVMRWSIRVRDPYTDPLHLLQAELMARLRDRDSDKVLESALMVTIAGIAAGLRNTG